MKKVLIVLLCILMGLPAVEGNAAAVSASKPPVMQADEGPILHIRIQIGRPKKNCTGFGICIIKLDVEPAPEPNQDAGAARGRGWMEAGRLHLELDRNSIEASTLETYFSGGNFRMEEEYPLPPELAASLGVSAYTIKAGNYTVSETGPASETLSVTF